MKALERLGAGLADVIFIFTVIIFAAILFGPIPDGLPAALFLAAVIIANRFVLYIGEGLLIVACWAAFGLYAIGAAGHRLGRRLRG